MKSQLRKLLAVSTPLTIVFSFIMTFILAIDYYGYLHSYNHHTQIVLQTYRETAYNFETISSWSNHAGNAVIVMLIAFIIIVSLFWLGLLLEEKNKEL